MTTEPRGSRLAKMDGFHIKRSRRKAFAPVADAVSGFDQLGGADGRWVTADPGQPALFERDPARLERDLLALWTRHGRTSLQPLASAMDGLAGRIRRRPLQAGEEISTDVYAMQ